MEKMVYFARKKALLHKEHEASIHTILEQEADIVVCSGSASFVLFIYSETVAHSWKGPTFSVDLPTSVNLI